MTLDKFLENICSLLASTKWEALPRRLTPRLVSVRESPPVLRRRRLHGLSCDRQPCEPDSGTNVLESIRSCCGDVGERTSIEPRVASRLGRRNLSTATARERVCPMIGKAGNLSLSLRSISRMATMDCKNLPPEWLRCVSWSPSEMSLKVASRSVVLRSHQKRLVSNFSQTVSSSHLSMAPRINLSSPAAAD
jgi:hypothetical protein